VFQVSLNNVLDQIAPLVVAAVGITPDEQIRRLGRAVNVILDELDDVSAIIDTDLLPRLIDSMTQHTMATDTTELQIGVAGDLRVDKRRRLVVDRMLQSIQRIPLAARPAAIREAIAALRQIITLLLEQGWASHLAADPETFKATCQTIIDIVQGHHTRPSARSSGKEDTSWESPLLTNHTVC
jgi:hypothetical protein